MVYTTDEAMRAATGARQPDPTEGHPELTSQHLTRPDVEVVQGRAEQVGASGPNPNLAQLMGEGETTFLQSFRPSNPITIPGGAGTGRVTMVLTNTAKWPVLLKKLSMVSSVHTDFLFRLVRSTDVFPIGSTFSHARNLGVSTRVPILLGNGIALRKQDTLSIEFINLSADATDVLVTFQALQIANPQQIPVMGGYSAQIAMLNSLYAADYWDDSLHRAQSIELLRHGRFYTFPLSKNTVTVDGTGGALSGSVDLAASPGPINSGFRNETGGRFIWESIVMTTNLGDVIAPGELFTYELEADGTGWKMTQGAVRSDALPGGTSATLPGLWIPAHLTRPYIIENDVDVTVIINGVAASTPGVYFAAVGTLIGGSRL